MNIVRNEILLVSKLIKVKDKVDKILKKWPIDKIFNEYVENILKQPASSDIHTFPLESLMEINTDPRILKSPFLFYPVQESNDRNNPATYGLIPSMETINGKVRKRLTSRGMKTKKLSKFKKIVNKLLNRGPFPGDSDYPKYPMNLGMFKNVKLIAVYVDTESDWYKAKELLPNTKIIIKEKLNHEWVHVEQLIRSKKLKDSDEGMDILDVFDSKEFAYLNKHQRTIFKLHDSKYLKEVRKRTLAVLKKRVETGRLDKEQLKKSARTTELKKALRLVMESHTRGEEYLTRKSEIHAFAVSAAEMFIQGRLGDLDDLLMNYLAIGVESKKIRNKFFRLYSEALQERGLSSSEVSEHVNLIYKNLYPKVKASVNSVIQQFKEFLKEE